MNTMKYSVFHTLILRNGFLSLRGLDAALLLSLSI